MAKKLIVIAPRHKTTGAPGAALYCPLALAINDVLREGYYAGVEDKQLNIYNQERRKIFVSRQPRPITRFFEEDAKEHIRPSEIVLDIPIEYLRANV